MAVNQLTSCNRVDSHHYSKHYSKCYWCERATNLGVYIFPDVANKAKPFSDINRTLSSLNPPNDDAQRNISITYNN